MKANFTRTGLVVLGFIVCALLAAGCYTVLVHPQVETTGDDQASRTCADCHSSSDYYYWHFPYQYNWYSHYPSWNRYYHDPWWWDNYWYWKDGDGGESPRAPQGHLWQPRTAPQTQPSIAPGSSTNSGDGSKASDKGSGSGTQKDGSEEKQHLFQPRVPPKSDDDDKSENTPKPESPSQEKSEEKR